MYRLILFNSISRSAPKVGMPPRAWFEISPDDAPASTRAIVPLPNLSLSLAMQLKTFLTTRASDSESVRRCACGSPYSNRSVPGCRDSRVCLLGRARVCSELSFRAVGTAGGPGLPASLRRLAGPLSVRTPGRSLFCCAGRRLAVNLGSHEEQAPQRLIRLASPK